MAIIGMDSLTGGGGFSGSSSATGETGDQSFGSAFIVNQGGSSGGASQSMTWAIAAAGVAVLFAVVLIMRPR